MAEKQVSVFSFVTAPLILNSSQIGKLTDFPLLPPSPLNLELHIFGTFIVPTLLRGEELYTQMGFFLFSEFSPIDIFIVES